MREGQTESLSMNQWIVPDWSGGLQGRRQSDEEEGNRSSQVRFEQKNLTYSNHIVDPMPKYAVDVTWENGERQPAAHRHRELLPAPSTDDTLESLVRQAIQQGQSRAGQCDQSSRPKPMVAQSSRKRTWSNPECCQMNITNSMPAEHGDFGTLDGAAASFCRDKDSTLMTWASSESPGSFKTSYTDEDSARRDGSGEHAIKKSVGCCSAKRVRAASVNNQSERRGRDRINQRMKDLQKLVPTGSKADKASLLDDTIQYLQQLQAQVQLMNCIRTIPPMVMPLGTHPQLQMSLLASRMAMAVGLLDGDSTARNTAQSIARLFHPTAAAASHAFGPLLPILVPPMAPTTQPKASLSTNASVPQLADPFCSFAEQQSMNMDLYSKMITLYCQEVNKTPRRTGKSSLRSHSVEGVKEGVRSLPK